MAIKRKKIFKIILISIAGLSAILILINITLNIYFKNILEDTFNQELNANVKIQKVRINFFSSKVKIIGFTITGKNEFNSDTLINIDKAVIALNDYDAKKNLIVLENFSIYNPEINVITSKYGITNWESAISSFSQKDSLNNDEMQVKLFVKNINIINGSIKQIDKINNKQQSVNNININIESNKTDSTINTNFELDVFVNTSYLKNNINSSGNLLIKNDVYNLNSFNKIGETQFNLNGSYSNDTISNGDFFAKLYIDFSNPNNYSNSGKLKIDISGKSLISNIKPTHIGAMLSADSISISNFNKDKYFFDGNLSLGYKEDTTNTIFINSDYINIISNNDTIAGAFNISANNDSLFIESNFTNSDTLHFCNKEDIFTLNIKSDLNCLTDKNISGEFRTYFETYSLIHPNDKNLTINLILHEFNSEFAVEYDYDIFNGKTSIKVPNLQSYYIDSIIDILITTDIKYLDLSKLKTNSPKLKSNLNPQQTTFKLPKHFNYQITTNIDKIITPTTSISNIHSILNITSDKIELEKFHLDIGNGYIDANFCLNYNDTNTSFYNDIIIQNLDFSLLSSSPGLLAGNINLESHNNLPYLYDTTHIINNKGTNLLILKDFRLKTDIFEEYAIDINSIEIDSAKIEINLNEDSLTISPTSFNINDALVNIYGGMHIYNNIMQTNVLIDIPNNYFSTKTKMLLSLIAKNKILKKQKSKSNDRKYYLIQIQGEINNPKVLFFEQE